MSRTPIDPLDADPLLTAMKDLPEPSCAEEVDRRILRRSRALYTQERGGATRMGALLAAARTVAVPVSLAGVVALYMTWAIDAALLPFR